jgi:hypothetical protein
MTTPFGYRPADNTTVVAGTGAAPSIAFRTGAPISESTAPIAGANLKYPLNLFSSADATETNSSHAISPAFIKFNILEVLRNSTMEDTISYIGDTAANGITGAYNDIKSVKELKEIYAAVENATTRLAGAATDIAKSAIEAAPKILQARLETIPTGTTVALYMPPAIQINDSMAYDSIDTRGVSELIAEMAGQNATDALKTGLGAASPIVANHILSKYARTGGILSGSIANALISSGKVANPATKLLFRGPALRQIQFDFRLVPTSQIEAEQITKIISVFRQAAYPGIDATAGGALYTIPCLFDIKFAFRNSMGRNPYMIHYKRCYLTQITTTYNGSGVAGFYKDGSPIETNLTLTFQETETNTAVDIHGSGNVRAVSSKRGGDSDGKMDSIY